MKRLLSALLAATLAAPGVFAQSVPPPADTTAPPAAATSPPDAPKPAPSATKAGRASNADLQAAVDRLTRANQDLLDLLKQQQAVLEDIQYDRRLQNRQITLIEQRLEDTLQLNAALQAKVAKLEAQAADAASDKSSSPPVGDASLSAPTNTPTAAPDAPPASYLPPEETGGSPGTMWWHRLLSLEGEDSQNSKMFHITGRQWRVLWHNQDRPGDTYKNTSALFISAFPENDTIPKKVCSQLGSGGDSTELRGPGDYYLKIEASGGHWELAVEDFQ
jgi:hypothetical protein